MQKRKGHFLKETLSHSYRAYNRGLENLHDFLECVVKMVMYTHIIITDRYLETYRTVTQFCVLRVNMNDHPCMYINQQGV